MPIQNVLDSLGNSMQLYVHEKKPQYFCCPDLNAELVENMPDYPLREDDVLLCSYPKSGCHWVWEITRMLLKGTTRIDDVDKENFMMEFPVTSPICELLSPRVLNNHQFFDNQPKDVLEKKVKVVFVYRNPKDVAVSFYFHHKRIHEEYQYTGPDFAAYLSRFTDGLVDFGCVFDYLKDWERAINEHKGLNICVLCYENLKSNPFPELKKLSDFLGVDHSDDFIKSVFEATDIDKMRGAKTKSFKDNDGQIMFRKGTVGDWKNHFTVANSEWFDHLTRTRMGDSKLFKFRYDL